MVNTNVIEIPQNNYDVVADYIADTIKEHLSIGEQVVWFVSGGSNVGLAKLARSKLNLRPYKNKLHVCLVDERFGPVGHSDSNWQQLLDLGFDMSNCQVYPIINNKDNATDTVKEYNYNIKNLLGYGYYSIGQLGLGPDGHTSGLLPNNPLMDSKDYYGYYVGPDYQRITSTPKLINNLNEVVLFVSGHSKAKALQSMINKGSVNEIPARILKHVKKLTIFTDITIKGDL